MNSEKRHSDSRRSATQLLIHPVIEQKDQEQAEYERNDLSRQNGI